MINKRPMTIDMKWLMPKVSWVLLAFPPPFPILSMPSLSLHRLALQKHLLHFSSLHFSTSLWLFSSGAFNKKYADHESSFFLFDLLLVFDCVLCFLGRGFFNSIVIYSALFLLSGWGLGWGMFYLLWFSLLFFFWIFLDEDYSVLSGRMLWKNMWFYLLFFMESRSGC